MPEVKAAVLERSRRSTAGQRMSTLVGQAQEDDDTFWSHPVWSEAGGGFAKAGKKRRRGDDGDDGSASSSGEGGESGDEGSISDGEGSYRISDVDSEEAKDEFDSDFDESESDDDSDEGEGEEELELRAEERKDAVSKRKKNQRLGVAPIKQPVVSSAGRQLMKKKDGKGKKGMSRRGPMGTGLNEGLVLNWPPPDGTLPFVLDSEPGRVSDFISSNIGANDVLVLQSTTIPGATASSAPIIDSTHHSKPTIDSHETQHQYSFSKTSAATTALTSHSSIEPSTSSIAKHPVSSKASIPTNGEKQVRKRNLREGTISKTIATEHSVAQSTKLTQKRQAVINEKKKSNQNKRHFTQEELILEAIKDTETENSKWLHSRKRTKEEAALLEKSAGGGGKDKSGASGATPISRFYSRRGCYNTLTFMDMDHVPEVFTRRNPPPSTLGVHSQNYQNSNGLSTQKQTTSSKYRTADDDNESSQQLEKTQTMCVITGKVAKYRDPKTLLGYHDIECYRELRRRLEAGELSSNFPSQQLHNQQQRPQMQQQQKEQRRKTNPATLMESYESKSHNNGEGANGTIQSAVNDQCHSTLN